MTNKVVATFAALIGVSAIAYGAYRFGLSRNPAIQHSVNEPASRATTDASGSEAAPDKRILYWHDPMVPGQKFDKPGKSPFMDMQLVPVYADSDSEEGAVTINPRIQQNLGVRVSEVTKGTMTQTVEAVGNVAYNERAVAVVTARANGYVERLYVRAPLDPVRVGQALADIFAPDWLAAQEEYLSVKRMQGQGTEGLVSAARQRMLLAGMNDEQVRLVESSGKVSPRFTLRAPIAGVVSELGAREGMTVMAGAMLFRINGLASVWINAEVPEGMAAYIRPGNNVEARTSAFPDRVFKGRVAAILPEVNPTTRTLKARVEVNNQGGLLAPGMFANVTFGTSARDEVLMVPSEAVIQTGARKVVILAEGNGNFKPVDVETGLEANGQIAIPKGLQAGQKVVTSSQFLIDSEASLKGTIARMSEMPAGNESPATTHHGEAKVEAVGKDAVTLSHGPIQSMQWGAMTMDFKIPPEGLPPGIKNGSTVTFDFKQRKDGQYELTAISPANPGAAGAKATHK